MALKIIISLVFIGLFVIKMFFPNIKIDNTSIILVILAICPWILQYIKSLEINGVGKFELANKEEKGKIEEIASDAGIDNIDSRQNSQYAFFNLRYTDTKLALASLRVEIESCLRKIAEANGLDVNYKGIRQITDILNAHQLIDKNEIMVIHDLSGILNKAVHSQMDKYDVNDTNWVFDMGMKLLTSLNQKIK